MPARHVIGLTGNIASGKGVVASLLAELGAEVIDADVIAHECLAPGTAEAKAVAHRFGSGILAADGSVDRSGLGRIVFRDPKALSDLEAILHPAVRQRILQQLEASTARVVVIEAIKLLEGPLIDHVQSVWVVAAPRATRLRRLMERSDLTAQEAVERVDAQSPEEHKVARAHVVLRNDGSLGELRLQVARAWADLVEAASDRQ